MADRSPSHVGIGTVFALLAALPVSALASDMAGAGAGALLAMAWAALAVANVLVTVLIAWRRARAGRSGALAYLLVPLETVLFTGVTILLAGHALLDLFVLFAAPIPMAAWGLAHYLHREREPEFRYRPPKYRRR